MKTSVDTINGEPFTFIWHYEPEAQGIHMQLHNGAYILVDLERKHCASALPALPRHPTAEDVELLHLYAAHGLRIFGTLSDLPAITGHEGRCEFIPIADMVYCDYEDRDAYEAMIECDNTDFEFTVTHAINRATGERVDVAIREDSDVQ